MPRGMSTAAMESHDDGISFGDLLMCLDSHYGLASRFVQGTLAELAQILGYAKVGADTVLTYSDAQILMEEIGAPSLTPEELRAFKEPQQPLELFEEESTLDLNALDDNYVESSDNADFQELSNLTRFKFGDRITVSRRPQELSNSTRFKFGDRITVSRKPKFFAVCVSCSQLHHVEGRPAHVVRCRGSAFRLTHRPMMPQPFSMANSAKFKEIQVLTARLL